MTNDMAHGPLLAAPWREHAPARAVAWQTDAHAEPSWQTLKAFQADIGAWQATLDMHAESPCRWMLSTHDPYRFGCALIAAWERGDHVILPADTRPATLEALDNLGATRLGDLPGGLMASATPRAPRWGQLAPRRVAVSLYTSGSTGEPQRLDKSFAQLDAELGMHAALWPLDARLTLSQVSHQHIYGLLFSVLRPLCERSPFATDVCRYPETLLLWLARWHSQTRREAVLISAPPTLERLPETLDWSTVEGVLARIHSSGAPLPRAAAAHAQRLLGAEVREVYGSSETGGIAWRVQSRDTGWTAFPGVEVRNDDAHRLWLRTPWLSTPDTWTPQADHVTVEGERFRLLGRSDRIAKVGGKRVSLTALERALGELPGVRQAHCTPLPKRDGRLGVIVELAPEAVPHDHDTRRRLTQSLRAALAPRFENAVLPRYWRFVEAWPRDAQGKLGATCLSRLFADLDDPRTPRWLGETLNGPHSARLTLEVPERLAYVEGHFAAQPVVPGVVMVRWALHAARDSLGLHGVCRDMTRIKFPLLLLPGERVTLTLNATHETARNHVEHHVQNDAHGSGMMIELRFTFASQRGTHGTGTLTLTEGAHHA
ncbi:acyl-coenzyme A synthetase/AMP-(fatty) acid ligase [Chromohalobacter marismortui]|uniref:Acyl-coenzyme A synthetase/AMP-(Fatty) acid ligase n=1 Tax=Chromohalobacter marismortui TaxID=42055 RepID=A0A4R7NMN0_9GAMM|nr:MULTISPECIES: AMP-binding protein [Chromohalobacter]MCI0510233.1 AMP-binding protein [Chromohalobacter sp.]MCI0593409.1 AMP-binding protein [Chromohalobacter sp.]TDU21651.1 acyl-coenzyme A synthetase/AMP-(fatty) acid ligase [Chromohalobacter marismortui]